VARYCLINTCLFSNVKISNLIYFFFLGGGSGDSPASEFFLPYTTYEDGTGCSEKSAHNIQTLGNHPNDIIQQSEHGEGLKSRISNFINSGNSSVTQKHVSVNLGKMQQNKLKYQEQF
jgi:hypothetical protein